MIDIRTIVLNTPLNCPMLTILYLFVIIVKGLSVCMRVISLLLSKIAKIVGSKCILKQVEESVFYSTASTDFSPAASPLLFKQWAASRPIFDLAKICGAVIEKFRFFNLFEYNNERDITSFAIDSRSVLAGGIFFALAGERVDGHDFLFDVSSRGGLSAVVRSDYSGDSFGLVLIYVDDVLESLHCLAGYVLRERGTRVIGVTGSVGKTTTKEFIAHILSGKYKVCKSQGTRNTQRSLPLAILNAVGDEDFIVLEMAMTEKGHIKKLVKMAPPDVAVVTRITFAHAENFESLEDIAQAKAEIFAETTSLAVVHTDSYKFASIGECCPIDTVLYPIELKIVSPFVEDHFTENFSCACAVGLGLGLSWEELETYSRGIKSIDRRFVKIERGGVTYIDDSYNANRESMMAAMRNLPNPSDGGRRIGVLGSMGELGKFSKDIHVQVGEYALLKLDFLFCVGEEMVDVFDLFSSNGKPVRYFTDYCELKKSLMMEVRFGDVVLVKGSHCHELWKVLDFE